MIKSVVSTALPVDEKLEIQKNRIMPLRPDGKQKIFSVVTGTHGDELEGQYVCYRLNQILKNNREKLGGIVDIYPALNPLGVDTITRGIPRFDLDMNRIFPGDSGGTMAEYVAAGVMEDLAKSDFCIDIHASNICSQLNKRLKQMEREGRICPGKEILVIPAANLYSINVGKRFWPSDNTDINRMFPGYALGETTQRIAAGIFEPIRHYKYGIHFCSSYTKGNYLPHVRIMHTGFEDISLARGFGLPYVIIREPKPYDTTTLNYNWQIWETAAFFVYTGGTERIDYVSAEKGELLAEIIDPYNGEVSEEITAPKKGRIFFQRDRSLVYAGAVVFKQI